MPEISLVFPHQLFKKNPCLHPTRPVYLIEEWLFFKQYNFNKQKLILHRASMKFYAQWLQQRGFTVTYIDAQDEQSDLRKFISGLVEKEVAVIHYTEVTDDWLEQRLGVAIKFNIHLISYKTPAFLTTVQEGDDYFSQHPYFQTDFYIWQRQKRSLLLEKGKPLSGKWSFDRDNRKRLRKGAILPPVSLPQKNSYVVEARQYVAQNFKYNIGATASPFNPNDASFYPTTFDEAERWLQDFFIYRFALFGRYEDAMIGSQHVLFHSVLSPLLNIGLLTPQHVIDCTLDAAVAYAIPINSLEGFIRQIIGWREYIRLLYEREGRKQRTRNYWKFNRPVPDSFRQGTTGITPVDTVIKKVVQSGYSHHIERLMVMGNFMMLCEFHPDEVYRWFMELYADAYDWVMVPNTYGMTQFSDGGLMMTKPYISGSNYLLKMGDWKRGSWEGVWDALFWRFMQVHRSFFEQNPRLHFLLKTIDNMPEEKRKEYIKTADVFLEGLEKKDANTPATLF